MWSGTPTEDSWPGISSIEEFKSYNFPKYKPQPFINHAPRYLHRVCVCVQVLHCRFIRCVCHEFVYSVTVLWLQCVCLATQSKWPWPQSLCVSVPMLLWESLCMFWCMLEIRVRASKAGFPLEFLRPCASFLSFASLICQPADGHISFSLPLPLSPFPSTGWILKE